MPAPAGNPWIYGLHYWSGAADLFGGTVGSALAKPGWVVEFGYTHDFPRLTIWGASPPQADTDSVAVQGVQRASQYNLTVIVRIDGDGARTVFKITDAQYAEYKQRVLDAIAVLRQPPYNVHRFILGNEPNLATSPTITADEYAAVYNDVRAAVAAQYSDVELLVAAVAPWSGGGSPPAGPYAGEPWKNYFHRILEQLNTADGFAIHSYGQHSWSWTSDPRADGEDGFQIYKWWMKEIDTYWQAPKDFAQKPVYLTELNTSADGSQTPNPPQGGTCDGGSPAGNYQNFWINKAFEDIDLFNRSHEHRISCACWFVGQNGRYWDCFSLESGLGAMPTARSNWVAMVNTTEYRNGSGDQLAVVYNLDVANSDLSSPDPNRIVLGAYRGSFPWQGQFTDWGSGGPLGVADNFVILHAQRFWAPTEGWYNFATTSDDGSWLWVDGQIIVDNSGLHGTQRREGSKYLKPGVHVVVFKMFESGGGASAGYEYQPPGGSWQQFPNNVYTGTAHAWTLDVANSDLNSPDWNLIKHGSWIYDFRWEGGPTENWSGGPGNQPDDFIVEHVRYFWVPQDGGYWFRVKSDDGAWLWIDGEIVINNYGLHGPQEATGNKYLRVGWHILHFKMFEHTGGATLSIQWDVPPGTPNYTTKVIGTFKDAAPCGRSRNEWPSADSCA